ncbi:MAG: holo-[acyl-carrier-protein] synthase [Chitinivibrionales bacterium]|nr:holo-[acyl-carrier-protein] synthase [Chitinivibrionales bacterium]
MIGVGVDIVDIDRIERLLERYGETFSLKVFTERETAYCGRMARPAVHYAGRFAVKEAFYKALPPSCQAVAHWCSIETISDQEAGRPSVHVVDERLAAALSIAGVSDILVSISHERHMCIAYVALQ